jgi:hypothetical protein
MAFSSYSYFIPFSICRFLEPTTMGNKKEKEEEEEEENNDDD